MITRTSQYLNLRGFWRVGGVHGRVSVVLVLVLVAVSQAVRGPSSMTTRPLGAMTIICRWINNYVVRELCIYSYEYGGRRYTICSNNGSVARIGSRIRGYQCLSIPKSYGL